MSFDSWCRSPVDVVAVGGAEKSFYAPDAWKRFVPDSINPNWCMARIWNLGLRGQCTHKVAGDGLCSTHVRQDELPHGLVEGPMPAAKLKAMMRVADTVLARAGSVQGEAAQVVLSERRKCLAARRKIPWYSRYHMFKQAQAICKAKAPSEVLQNLTDLDAEDFLKSLMATSATLRQNPTLRRGMVKDKGPKSLFERLGPVLIDLTARAVDSVTSGTRDRNSITRSSFLRVGTGTVALKCSVTLLCVTLRRLFTGIRW
jgi:hypothetical protein